MPPTYTSQAAPVQPKRPALKSPPPAPSSPAASDVPDAVSSSSDGSVGLSSLMLVLPTLGRVAAAVLAVKACVTLYHHFQHFKAEREVRRLREVFANQPMLILAAAGAGINASEVHTNGLEDAEKDLRLVPMEAADTQSSWSQRCRSDNGSSSGEFRDSPAPSPPSSVLHSKSALSSIRVLSVRAPRPGQWRSMPENTQSQAYHHLEKVLAHVHLFMQPRWALAPSLSVEATLVESYMRLHKIPYTVHVVNVLHGGHAESGDGSGGAGGAARRIFESGGGGSLRGTRRASSLAASWDPTRDPTGQYSGLTEEEMLAEQVRRVHARVFSASRRQSATVSSSADASKTLVGQLLQLLRSVQQAEVRRLPFLVHRGELVEGDTVALIAFLNEKFHIVSDAFLFRDNAEVASRALAVRHTVDHTLRSEYGVGFLQDSPGVFCRYASEALGPVASPWALRGWLALPWIGSPLRKDLHRTLVAAGVHWLPRQQRQEQALREIAYLESILRVEGRTGDEDDGLSVARPYVLMEHPTTVDCGLYAYLLPIMRLSASDLNAMRNNVFNYIANSPVLRDYVTNFTANVFPDLELMAATVTGVPLAIPYDRERVASRVARRRQQLQLQQQQQQQQYHQGESPAFRTPYHVGVGDNSTATTSFFTAGTTGIHPPEDNVGGGRNKFGAEQPPHASPCEPHTADSSLPQAALAHTAAEGSAALPTRQEGAGVRAEVPASVPCNSGRSSHRAESPAARPPPSPSLFPHAASPDAGADSQEGTMATPDHSHEREEVSRGASGQAAPPPSEDPSAPLSRSPSLAQSASVAPAPVARSSAAAKARTRTSITGGAQSTTAAARASRSAGGTATTTRAKAVAVVATPPTRTAASATRSTAATTAHASTTTRTRETNGTSPASAAKAKREPSQASTLSVAKDRVSCSSTQAPSFRLLSSPH